MCQNSRYELTKQKTTQTAVVMVQGDKFVLLQLRPIVRHLQLHKSLDVINTRCFSVRVCGAKSLLHQVLLPPLDLHHLLLYRVFYNEL